MTIKQERAAALEDLKTRGNGCILYRVERLNNSFSPVDVFTFDSAKDAETQYTRLLEAFPPAFIRKYAVVPF